MLCANKYTRTLNVITRRHGPSRVLYLRARACACGVGNRANIEFFVRLHYAGSCPSLLLLLLPIEQHANCYYMCTHARTLARAYSLCL